MASESNPLLQPSWFPDFTQFSPEQVEPAIDQILTENRAAIARLAALESPTWENFACVLEGLEDRLENAWSVVSHMNGVMNSEALRQAYDTCMKKVTEYATEFGHNRALWEGYRKIAEGAERKSLDTAQKRALSNILKDFHLSGVDLPSDKKARFAELSQKLADLSNRFSNNLLDATHAWTLHVEDECRLQGLPESARQSAQHQAEQKGLSGYVFTLDVPSYLPVMTYCDDAALREQMYEAYVTRASECGPNAGQWDNSGIIREIMATRVELAGILGFEQYADVSLAKKMAGSTEEVLSFLSELAEKSLPFARAELASLNAFAQSEFGVDALQSWDTSYYSEKQRQKLFEFSQEDVRPYFPLPKVLDGLFACVKRLFNVEISPLAGVPVWQDDVQVFEVSANGERIAAFYLDVYARANKRGGAWMAGCRQRRRLPTGELQLPIAYLTCNFTAPVGGKPSLLTHNEVTTLFHEFGHGLHHMLTQVEVAAVSGINGVAWDAVELPSQFLENWCWHPEGLALISGHVDTGEPLPEAMLVKMLRAKNFQAGMFTVRQLEFGIFDFRLHAESTADQPVDVLALIEDVRAQVAVFIPPAYNRFTHSFSHIFAGGYAAGYYSYKWAEVLAADAFSRFEETGIFDEATGADFKRCILEKGGSEEPMDLFVAFRGRKPSVEPLLRHSGLLVEENN